MISFFSIHQYSDGSVYTGSKGFGELLLRPSLFFWVHVNCGVCLLGTRLAVLASYSYTPLSVAFDQRLVR